MDYVVSTFVEQPAALLPLLQEQEFQNELPGSRLELVAVVTTSLHSIGASYSRSVVLVHAIIGSWLCRF
eukprot:scaffold848_cov153-Skeletonema_menzelii.AAC.4